METLLARVTSMDTTVQELKTQWDLRVERKKAQKAIIQWALSILMGIGVLVGIVSRHEAGLIERILSGLLLHPLP